METDRSTHTAATAAGAAADGCEPGAERVQEYPLPWVLTVMLVTGGEAPQSPAPLPTQVTQADVEVYEQARTLARSAFTRIIQ